ncbi:SIS domain-containing protein [Candidatus Latescibacterota bacterium]
MSKKTAEYVLRVEAEAITSLIERIGPDFERAEQIILAARGRVIVTGLGKSGIVGRKIASTLSSIGIPAFYLHPVEGAHGDIGMVMRGDVAVVISKSGSTDELNLILNHLKRLEIPIIAMTGNPGSNLSGVADVTLDISVEREACPFNIVPTASTTAALALGDALAISLFEKKKLTAEDFAALHPGGSIGRKLSYRVKDLMISGDNLPLVDIEAPMKKVIDVMSEKKLGIALITENGELAGVISDGDLRRLLQRLERPLEVNAREALSRSSRDNSPRKPPLTIDPNAYAARAVNIMEKHIVTTLIVINPEKIPIGLIRWIDMSLAGLV